MGIKVNIVDIESHMKILNYLVYMQMNGLIDESQRLHFSSYIQMYLKEKEDNTELMNSIFNILRSERYIDNE